MRDPSWPLLDLCLRIGDLVLQSPDEAEQAALALLVPDDLELDAPGRTTTRRWGSPARSATGPTASTCTSATTASTP